MLKNLEDQTKIYHLIQTHSEQAKAFIEQKMAQAVGTEPNEIIHCDNWDVLQKNMPTLCTPPFFTTEHLCIINVPRNRTNELKKYLQQMNRSYAVYLIYVATYSDYKQMLSVLPPDKTNPMYLNHVSKQDISYIMQRNAVKLTEDMYKKLCYDYQRNIDAVLQLNQYLNDNPTEPTITTAGELRGIAGSPDPDIMGWVLALADRLENAPARYEGKTYKEWDKSTARSIRNITAKMMPLCEEKSPEYVRVCLKNVLSEIISMKQDYLQSLPLQKEHDRYKPREERIMKHPLPIYAWIAGKVTENGKWTTQEDLLGFIYEVYSQ